MSVISVENVSKLYRLGEVGTGTLAHDLNRWWHKIRGKEDPYLKIGQVNDRTKKAGKDDESNSKNTTSPTKSISAFPRFSFSEFSRDYVWALKDINFEVRQGEILGIIGRNGAGKSTLLKILSRVTMPTTGQIKVKGRIASLLEVGTGFHPDLTGRDNIYLNGAILGMRKHEIKSKFDEIVDFAGVERYIDTPVKRYSSGMYVRLAFAVAAHLEPEILVVDEVLAVGDAEFQKKCLGKMQDVAGHGRTVLFVSHNMTAVQSLCRRALLLAQGQLFMEGPVPSVIARYFEEGQSGDGISLWSSAETAPGNHLLRIKQIRVLNDSDRTGNLLTMQSPVLVETDFWVINNSVATHITYHLFNEQGIIVLTSGCQSEKRTEGLYKSSFRLPANLLNSGRYFLKLLIVENGTKATYEKEGIVSFTVQDTGERDHAYMGREPGVVQIKLAWNTEPLAA